MFAIAIVARLDRDDVAVRDVVDWVAEVGREVRTLVLLVSGGQSDIFGLVACLVEPVCWFPV